VTSQALKYDVITYTPYEGLNYSILDKVTPLWKRIGEPPEIQIGCYRGDIHKLGLVGLNIANKSSLQWKITMQERYLCWPPYLFPWPRSAPHFFHSRIATVTPLGHLLTRLIHICSSCWTIYRSLEIALEMGTVDWIELQIQCAMQIHCFKKHSVRYELNFKKYLAT